jgi:hypothetical protein
MPLPHDPLRGPALRERYDGLSVRDRLERLRGVGLREKVS